MNALKKIWKLFVATLAGIFLVLVSSAVFVFLVFLAAIQFTVACAETLAEYYKLILTNKEK